MAFDCVVFDCDGVLVDSEPLALEAAVGVFADWIPGLDAARFAERFAGLSDEEIIDALARENGRAAPADLSARIERAIDARLAEAVEGVPGIAAALDAIALPMAVASNSPRHRVELSLDRAGIKARFEGRLCCADMVARPKPDPDVYLMAAERLGAAPGACIAVEDSTTGIAAARAAGMTVLGFTGGGHTWPGHAEALTAAGAARIVPHMADLPGTLAAIG
ncbi:MAG: HAD-IA family hydrolase [Azospirillaceae bacterium]